MRSSRSTLAHPAPERRHSTSRASVDSRSGARTRRTSPGPAWRSRTPPDGGLRRWRPWGPSSGSRALFGGTAGAGPAGFGLRVRLCAREIAGRLVAALVQFRPVLAPLLGVGTLGAAAAARLGLPAATPVVLGGADSQSCALGAGVI